MNHQFRPPGVLGFAVLGMLTVACASGAGAEPSRREAVSQWCTVTFGAVLSLTGTNASQGRQAKDGYETFSKVVNRAGGLDIGGRRCLIEMRYRDDASDGRAARRLLVELATEEASVDFLVGESSDSSHAAVTQVHGVLMLTGPSADVSAGVGATSGCQEDRSPVSRSTLRPDSEHVCLTRYGEVAARRLELFQQAIEAAGSIDAQAVMRELRATPGTDR